MNRRTLRSLWEELEKCAAKLKTELLPHQERVVQKIKGQRGLVVAHGLGSGKTLSSVAAAVQLKPDSTKVLVPASLQENYKKEMRKHVKGRLPGKLKVESLQNYASKGLIPNSDLLVVDEAHRARNPASKTYQILHDADNKKRLLLTASPTYNRPADVATLVNLAAGDKVLPAGAEFDKRYIAKPAKGVWSLLPFTRKRPGLVRKHELKKPLQKWVDYHKAEGADFPDTSEERVVTRMSKRQTQLHDHAWGKLPLMTRIRLRRGLPPGKEDLPKMNFFMGQSRQIASTESPFTKGQAETSPKLVRAVDDLSARTAENPRHRGLVYSNYLGTLRDYSRELEKRKIPHAAFTGAQSQKTRKQLVRDYNKGKLKALLVSSAGGEGLDLKGTRQVQVLEPHWNEEKLKQVIGRAVRHGSHSHLPAEERHVNIQRFEAKPRHGGRGVEQVLYDTAEDKERLNQELRGLITKGQRHG